ncbi:lipid droplet-associated protein [Rhodococcus rhodnii]|uniref:DUF8129 domain-containing protein n=2 Tax=Rhodococcus rhodnii TaxID=38312 RepID=R7WNR8_9NOCA|nr:lipid droplet-associated protein [Rhodococcus rhodnii]EOM75649.1 hypothetical protein Rrhod_3109 [Rhodococcus rhodnii LMG 5362]TXG91834.1 lipid droplet-associated protein [Rhodococcus rhodnii]
MIRPPFAARVALGLAVTAVDEVRRLPGAAAALPMTAVSQVLQTSMRVQQSITTLAIRGDEALELAGCGPGDGELAVFDDAADSSNRDSPNGQSPNGEAPDRGDAPAGRFALYTVAPDRSEADESASSGSGGGGEVGVPEIAEYLDYASLTLAQLRARLRTLSVDELAALLEYENATASRAPFQTMLENRITTARAK